MYTPKLFETSRLVSVSIGILMLDSDAKAERLSGVSAVTARIPKPRSLTLRLKSCQLTMDFLALGQKVPRMKSSTIGLPSKRSMV